MSDAKPMAQGLVVGLTRRRATVLPAGCDGADLSKHILCRLSAELAGRQQDRGLPLVIVCCLRNLSIAADAVEHEVVSVLPQGFEAGAS